MIKITKFLYVNWLVIPLILVSYFSGAIHTLLISYCVVAVHEICHLLGAVFLKVRIKSIIIMPFGMTLRLSDSLIKSPAKEALIAFLGPASNVFMAVLCALYCLCRHEILPMQAFFISVNAVIFALNLLPAMPLDGGRILRAILVEKIGFIGAVSVMKKLTHIICALVFILGFFVLILSRMNLSLIIVGAFLLIFVISDRKNNEFIIMKEILYSKDKLKNNETMKTKLLASGEDVSVFTLLNKFDYSSFHIIGVLDNEKRIKKFITECEIVDAVTKKSSLKRVGDV